MTIEFADMDLFDAPPGACLAHACNARGVWGAGVALGFSRRFPDARVAYEKWCRLHQLGAAGLAFVCGDNNGPEVRHWIGCLITSADYGMNRDSNLQILNNTARAIRDLDALLPPGTDVYMPRINSGIFAVPWEETLAVLERHCAYRRKWVVCTPAPET